MSSSCPTNHIIEAHNPSYCLQNTWIIVQTKNRVGALLLDYILKLFSNELQQAESSHEVDKAEAERHGDDTHDDTHFCHLVLLHMACSEGQRVRRS